MSRGNGREYVIMSQLPMAFVRHQDLHVLNEPSSNFMMLHRFLCGMRMYARPMFISTRSMVMVILLLGILLDGFTFMLASTRKGTLGDVVWLEEDVIRLTVTSHFSSVAVCWMYLMLYLLVIAPVVHGALPSLDLCRDRAAFYRVLRDSLMASQAYRREAASSFIETHGLLEMSMLLHVISYVAYSYRLQVSQELYTMLLTHMARSIGLCALYMSTSRRMLYTYDAYIVA